MDRCTRPIVGNLTGAFDISRRLHQKQIAPRALNLGNATAQVLYRGVEKRLGVRLDADLLIPDALNLRRVFCISSTHRRQS